MGLSVSKAYGSIIPFIDTFGSNVIFSVNAPDRIVLMDDTTRIFFEVNALLLIVHNEHDRRNDFGMLSKAFWCIFVSLVPPKTCVKAVLERAPDAMFFVVSPMYNTRRF